MAQTPKVIKINSLVLNRRIVVPPYLKIMTANLAKATVAVKTVYSRGESYEELHSHKVVHVMESPIEDVLLEKERHCKGKRGFTLDPKNGLKKCTETETLKHCGKSISG